MLRFPPLNDVGMPIMDWFAEAHHRELMWLNSQLSESLSKWMKGLSSPPR